MCNVFNELYDPTNCNSGQLRRVLQSPHFGIASQVCGGADADEVDDHEELGVDEDMEDEKETSDELFLGARVSEGEMERIYASNCASCHAMDLAGSVGPKLQTIGERYSKKEIADTDIIENGTGAMLPLDFVDKDESEVVPDWLAGFK